MFRVSPFDKSSHIGLKTAGKIPQAQVFICQNNIPIPIQIGDVNRDRYIVPANEDLGTRDASSCFEVYTGTFVRYGNQCCSKQVSFRLTVWIFGPFLPLE